MDFEWSWKVFVELRPSQCGFETQSFWAMWSWFVWKKLISQNFEQHSKQTHLKFLIGNSQFPFLMQTMRFNKTCIIYSGSQFSICASPMVCLITSLSLMPSERNTRRNFEHYRDNEKRTIILSKITSLFSMWKLGVGFCPMFSNRTVLSGVFDSVVAADCDFDPFIESSFAFNLE